MRVTSTRTYDTWEIFVTFRCSFLRFLAFFCYRNEREREREEEVEFGKDFVTNNGSTRPVWVYPWWTGRVSLKSFERMSKQMQVLLTLVIWQYIRTVPTVRTYTLRQIWPWTRKRERERERESVFLLGLFLQVQRSYVVVLWFTTVWTEGEGLVYSDWLFLCL